LLKILEEFMKVGFIGLGNVGGKLAGSLLRNNTDLTVFDINENIVSEFTAMGASMASNPKKLTESVDCIITCLPSPAISAQVVESDDGILKGISSDKIWIEMSTTNEKEVLRLGKLFEEKKAHILDCPVSGGCHRADTGNISIFSGGDYHIFQSVLPLLKFMGRRILHTGRLGSASILKVMTNYLASVNLVSIGEALAVCKLTGMDMKTTYEAIRISSGNSFVNETETQVILNGSYDVNFTMELVLKDIGIFNDLANDFEAPLEISPLLIKIFKEGREKYGPEAWSTMIVKRLEDACNIDFRATGFPAELKDDEPEEIGYEIK
jgi:3-hydroxyisobutyrate dehydrogenase|tara:strand:- start:4650 stop:5618 length:969 start_codon:yes stop_codon:yes gene_type:complete